MMEPHEEKQGFTYTYSAREQEEVRRIREKYSPRPEDKLEQLRRLDEGVTRKATVAALVLGVVGTLVLGLGMSCTLVWAETLFVPGIVIGVIGIAALCAAYPVYQHLVKKERERIAPEILRLTDELMKG